MKRTQFDDFDPFTPEFSRDPYGCYCELRNRPAATWSPPLGGWLLTRYQDARGVLRDLARFSSDDRRAHQSRERSSRPTRGRNIVGSDPPEHTRLRRILGRAFTPQIIARQEPRIRAHIDALLDRGLARGTFDAMADLAVPLPLIVIAEMLGVEPTDRDRFRLWAENEIMEITPATTPAEANRLVQSSEEMHDYFMSAIERARSRQGETDGIISLLVSAADDEDRLTADELISFVVLLLRAGSHTVTHLIGNGLLALLRNPNQFDALRADPRLWDTAVDELLRYAGPVQSVFRIASSPAEVHGVDVQSGDRVMVVLAAANRDERQFAEPDVLRLDRNPNEHLALGSGIHHCLGAALGRLETRLVIGRLLERTSRIEPADAGEPDWAWVWALRGLQCLPLRCQAAP